MKIESNGIRLEVDDLGGSAEPVLLIMGLAGQLIDWPDAFLHGLQAPGYRLLRFDNRDAGLSDASPARPPNLPWVGVQAWLGRTPRVPYTLSDMARDSLGVLDALNVPRAHVVGVSMGGMIAQRLALLAPERVHTLTSIMGCSGARGLLKPSGEMLRMMTAIQPRAYSADELAMFYTRMFSAIASRTYPPDLAALQAALQRTRQRHVPAPASFQRQLAAILADVERAGQLDQIRCPTLVMHGTDDRWVPPVCGQDTARRIPGAQLVMIADMGHDLVPVVHPEIVRRVLAALRPFLQAHPMPSRAASRST